MLGENHSLVHDFPELAKVIKELSQSDEVFAEENRRYTALDKQIRGLEMQDSPIDDDAMHGLKVERAALKDSLYGKLTQAGQSR